MDFRLLGPLEVRDDDRVLTLGAAKQRALLTTLLLHANEVVSADRLIEELWGDERPPTAENTLQAYVSRLRKALGGNRIRTSPPGYVTEVEPEELDVARFEHLAREGKQALARGEASLALNVLQQALALWRGKPLAELSHSSSVQIEIARLEEEHLSTLEDRLEAELAVGRHAETIGELTALSAQHPLRERLREQLMLALYRAGRQADALEVYRQTREFFVEELGLEPSRKLQQLQSDILIHDPSLETPGGAKRRATANYLGLGRPPADVMNSGGEQDAFTHPAWAIRRRVTVLCASVRETVALDPEVLITLNSRAVSILTSCIERHGGTMEQRRPQALIGVFGIPVAHEDDVFRAARAARDAVVEIEELNRKLEANSQARLKASIAIDTGEVLTSGHHVEGSVIGHTFDLLGAANGEKVLLGSAARRLLGEASSDRAEERNSWRLSDVSENRESIPRNFASPLVGRVPEMSHLREAYEAVKRERICRLVTVVGPAGIGKSRLVKELIRTRRAEATVLTGRCLSYGQGITLWPLVEIVREAAGDTTEEAIATLLGNSREGGRIAEHLATAFGSVRTAGAVEGTSAAFGRFVELIATRRPLIMTIEDIHWAEPTLLELIQDIVDSSRGAPILMLCLARPELVEKDPSWRRTRYNSSLLQLEPLAPAAADALIGSLPNHVRLAAAKRRAIRDAAEGNPLFIEQMGAHAKEGMGGRVDVPVTLHGLLAARLDGLAAEERALVERAAVIGREFWVGALLPLWREHCEHELETLLRSLTLKEFIEPTESAFVSEKAFRFRHGLIRETAYAGIPKAMRGSLHEICGNWLEESIGKYSHETEELVGYHLEHAYLNRAEIGAPGERDKETATRAAKHLSAAARRALARSDLPAAHNLFRRATALLPADHPARPRLLGDWAFVSRERGEVTESYALSEQARAGAHHQRDMVLEKRLALNQLRARMNFDASITVDEFVRESAVILGELKRIGERGEAARAKAYVAWGLNLQGQALQAEELLAIVMKDAEELGDVELRNSALVLRFGTWLYGPMPIDHALASCRSVRKNETSLRVEANALRTCGLLRAMQGEFEEARSLLNQGREIFDELGLSVISAASREVDGVVELLAGDATAAERTLRTGVSELRELQETMWLAGTAAVLAQAVFEQGRYREALELTRVSEANSNHDVAAPVHWLGVRAKVFAAFGHSAMAEELAKLAVRIADGTDFVDLCGEARMELAAVRILCGNLAEARRSIHQATLRFGVKGNLVSAARARSAALIGDGPVR